MQYRTMPKTKDRLSALGFGCMRFPTLKDGKIDEAKALEMLHHAYENKVNYFDTAWPYHSEESEPLLGKFLSQIDRTKVYVATKLPCWLIKSHEDMDKYLDLQLSRLGTDYIDYYLLHALGKQSWVNMKKNRVFEFLERAKAAGKIRHIGFSFHDSYPVFKQICLSYDWDFCQIMLNYLDTHYQAGRNGYELAVSRNMGVIAMEPLRGGKLISPIPDEIAKIWQKADPEGNALARATRWVWNLEGATVLLSGMSSLQQLKQNLDLANIAKANNLSEKELKVYKRIRREYIKRIPILCSECRYCLPCPQGVSIPSNFGVYNEAVMFSDPGRHLKEYKAFIPESARADKCTQCGACLLKCPHKIEIPTEMKKVADYFKNAPSEHEGKS